MQTLYNALQCTAKWVHKRCSDVKVRLTAVVNFVCKTCLSPARPENQLLEKISIEGDEFETVSEFVYLGDTVGQTGGCADAVTARIRSAWKAFHTLLPLNVSCEERKSLYDMRKNSTLLWQ